MSEPLIIYTKDLDISVSEYLDEEFFQDVDYIHITPDPNDAKGAYEEIDGVSNFPILAAKPVGSMFLEGRKTFEDTWFLEEKDFFDLYRSLTSEDVKKKFFSMAVDILT